MNNRTILAIIGVLVGAVAGSSISGHLADEYLLEYGAARLTDVELLSWKSFREQPPDISMATQSHYVHYSNGAWAAGAISDEEYFKAQALGLTRHCASQAMLPDSTGKPTLCTEAKRHFLLWRPCGDFDKFQATIAEGKKI